jgi:hypothetical protein
VPPCSDEPDHLTWREKDGQRFAVKITAAGRATIHVADGKEPTVEATAPPADQVSPEPIPADPPTTQTSPAIAAAPSKPATKIAIVIELMAREGGATLEEMMAATGWLSHSTRAVLSGLRKKGYELAKIKRGDSTCYCIAKAA